VATGAGVVVVVVVVVVVEVAGGGVVVERVVVVVGPVIVSGVLGWHPQSRARPSSAASVFAARLFSRTAKRPLLMTTPFAHFRYGDAEAIR
jgi:hypothetical protein